MRLPIEIICEIIKALVPVVNPSLIFEPHSGESKALFSFMLACRRTHEFASRLFRQHGLYINSKSGLQKFCDRIKAEAAAEADADADTETGRGNVVAMGLPPPIHALKNASAFYVAPWPVDKVEEVDTRTEEMVWEALNHVNGSLRCLVVQLPPGKRRSRPADLRCTDRRVEEFSQLEELTLVGGWPRVFSFNMVETMFPRVRRLAVSRAQLWSQPEKRLMSVLDRVAWMWEVETLVLLDPVLSPDADYQERSLVLNVKWMMREFFNLSRTSCKGRRLTVILGLPPGLDIWMDTEKWHVVDPENQVTVKVFTLQEVPEVLEKKKKMMRRWWRKGKRKKMVYSCVGDAWEMGDEIVYPGIILPES